MLLQVRIEAHRPIKDPQQPVIRPVRLHDEETAVRFQHAVDLSQSDDLQVQRHMVKNQTYERHVKTVICKRQLFDGRKFQMRGIASASGVLHGSANHIGRRIDAPNFARRAHAIRNAASQHSVPAPGIKDVIPRLQLGQRQRPFTKTPSQPKERALDVIPRCDPVEIPGVSLCDRSGPSGIGRGRLPMKYVHTTAIGHARSTAAAISVQTETPNHRRTEAVATSMPRTQNHVFRFEVALVISLFTVQSR
jgi:hypothetical protein